MPSPISEGRMLRKDISKSNKFAELTPSAAVLFAMLVPHFNAHGKMQAESYTIKGTVCPKIPYILTDPPSGTDEIERITNKYGTTPKLVSDLLEEITEKTSVKWFVAQDGLHYLHSLNNEEHQKLTKRKGEDRLPSWTDPLVPNQSRTSPEPVGVPNNSLTSPEPVPPEVEGGSRKLKEEVEGEGGGEGEGAGVAATDPGLPLGGGAGSLPKQLAGALVGKKAIGASGDDTEQAEPIDFANPEHFKMVSYLDELGVDTEPISTVKGLVIAYRMRKAFEKKEESVEN